jgi:alpha-1,3-rhamnosyl/mannosyltransferase
LLRAEPVPGIDSWKQKIKRWVPHAYAVNRSAQQALFTLGATRRHLDLYHDPSIISFKYRGPTVVTAHDLSWIRYPQMHPADRVRFLNQAFPRTLSSADHVITDAEFVRQEIMELFGVAPARITAIPLGAAAAFRPHAANECEVLLQQRGLRWRGYLLSVGTLEPRKNLELVVRAYAGLPAAFQDRFKLVLVGARGWLASGLESLLHPLVNAGRAQVLGFVADADLAVLYAAARTFIYPSTYEGFGLPPLEAMASGTPVIVSNASTLPEVAGDAGIRIEPTDVDGLRAAIERLGEDDEAWSHLREAGLNRAALFSWQRCARETMAIYRKVLGHDQ